MKVNLGSCIFGVLAGFPLKLFEFVCLSHGAKPDLLLMLSSALGYLGGWEYGVFAGFLTGFLEDMALGRILGLRPFTLAVSSMITASAKDYLAPEALIPRQFVAAGAIFISDCVSWGLLAASGYSFAADLFLRQIALPGVFWALVLVMPLTYILNWLSQAALRVLPQKSTEGRF